MVCEFYLDTHVYTYIYMYLFVYISQLKILGLHKLKDQSRASPDTTNTHARVYTRTFLVLLTVVNKFFPCL